ncbi:MAG: pantoate--beta-alanine ligase [Acidobacteriota bacterium]|nr:pantoate--beta-alanine ligase [Acidobacteriota bacterium]
MRTIISAAEMKAAGQAERAAGRSVGLVPTMGALHDGHLSLVRACRERADVVVVSLFVNPIQFGPNEDFTRYPRDLERDAGLLREAGAHILFAPEAAEMYPAGFRTRVEIEGLQDKLCGASRPGHFRGVCTVVLKLFHLVEPAVAVFGQKDAQQAIILKRMTRDLDLGLVIDVRPIVRETDGLAMSSRNAYLSPKERAAALVLSRALGEVRAAVRQGTLDAAVLKARMASILAAEPLARVDYAAIVDPEGLDPVAEVRAGDLVALAVHIGRTRLIDNWVVDSKG